MKTTQGRYIYRYARVERLVFPVLAADIGEYYFFDGSGGFAFKLWQCF